jgi:hypothetical protein
MAALEKAPLRLRRYSARCIIYCLGIVSAAKEDVCPEAIEYLELLPRDALGKSSALFVAVFFKNKISYVGAWAARCPLMLTAARRPDGNVPGTGWPAVGPTVADIDQVAGHGRHRNPGPLRVCAHRQPFF